MSKPRILYVPNESGSFRQIGFRRPLANLQNAELLSDVSVYSLQWRIGQGGDPEKHRDGLIRRVREFQPDIVLMQHLGATGLRDTHFRAMRAAADFKLIYHEADPYSRFLHPLPRSARSAGRFSDVVFTVGTGWFADNFKRNGARDVRWASHVFESERYRYEPVSAELSRAHDIVMIANRNTPRFRGLPNWRDRIAFVEYMQSRFKDRFAIYGNGWSGSSAMGPVDFSSQDRAIRSGWISANWDHYAEEPHYFSNRLPVSMSTGSIHATGFHPGYDEIFPEETKPFLKFSPTQRGLGDSIESFLECTTPAERVSIGATAQKYAYQHFRQDDQLVSFFNFDVTRVDANAAAEAWDIDASPVTDV
jgi:hypothetical protein